MDDTVAAPSSGPRGRAPLDRTTITRAAVELLDEVGLAELSTRRLAAKLGVQSPTLYWHVRNKADLLDLVAEAICADAFDIDERVGWREQLASGLQQFRRLLLAHRDAAVLLRERPPSGPHRLGHIETTARILLTAGFSEEETAWISRLLATHVLNSVNDESRSGRDDREAGPPGIAAAAAAYPHLRRLGPAFARLTADDFFERGVELILDGLAHRLNGA